MSIAAIKQPKGIIMNIVNRMTGKFIATLDNIIKGKVKDLQGAYLPGADLSGAYLTDANLSRANLSGANLSNTILDNVDFTNTIGNDKEVINIEIASCCVVATKDIIQIFNENHTHSEWAVFSDEDINKMQVISLSFWTEYKAMILETVKSNFNKG